jgi:hypothetical protein
MSNFVKTVNLLDFIEDKRYRDAVSSVCDFFFDEADDMSKLTYANYPTMLAGGFPLFADDEFFHRAHQHFLVTLGKLSKTVVNKNPHNYNQKTEARITEKELQKLSKILDTKFFTNK